MGRIALRNFQEIFGVEEIFSVIQSNPSFLLRRFVFRMVESRAKRDWLVMNRKEPWEGNSCLLPAFFLRAHFHRERETSGYEAGRIKWIEIRENVPRDKANSPN